jgi:alkylhydroperoxidase/carboxymuconolactone decarboxylase family protein YurZ
VQIDFLKGELTKRDGVINDQKNEIGELKHLLKCDRNRVKSLAQMTSPLIRYAETVTKIIHQKLGETGRYISHAALPTTYNFSNVIQDDVFDEFTNHKLNHDGKVMNGKAVSKTSSSKSSVVAAEIALKWITMVSQSADDQLPPPGGRKLMHYLPAHQIPESLFDLRSGKNLARAVVSIVLDRQSIVRQQDVGHPLPAFTVKYSKSWPQKGIEIEDLEHMKTLQNKTMELISFTLDLATHVLDLPHHSPNDVFSGKIDVIFQIVVELMNAAVPKMNQKERNSIEQRINRFYELNSELEQLQSDKPDLTTLNHLDYFLQREFQKRREISEEEALIANLKSHSDDNAAGETVYFGGGCEIDHRLVSTMNDKQYEKMCTIVDETITSGQYEKVTDLSTKIISINEQLLDLASVISQGRDQRDMEIRMTTEVRQLLLAQYMGHNFVVSQTPIQFNIQGTTIQQIHQIDQPVEHQHSS